jgi:enamine deaminase RidA (YjgF/YER057c/UK114 family)
MSQKSKSARESASYARVPRSGFTERAILIPPEACSLLREPGATEEVLGKSRATTSVFFGRRYVSGRAMAAEGFPLTHVTEKEEDDGRPHAGAYLHVVEDVIVRTIEFDGRIVGTYFEDDEAVYCYLSDIRTDDITLSRAAQTARLFEIMEESLAKASMDFHNVVRTWYFIDHLLDWYTEFNAVRGEFFTARGVFDRLVPASTGIGGGNPHGAALVAEAFAVKPKGDKVKVRAVPSPLQCPALAYGSSFSRAVEVATVDHRRLLVSGTASIAPEGHTVHVGDCAAQVDLTMRVVAAILESCNMPWGSVTRSVAYFKHRADLHLLETYCAAHGIQGLPVIAVHNDVCRDDLLFEIEVDAIVETLPEND